MKRIVCFHSDVDFGVATHLAVGPRDDLGLVAEDLVHHVLSFVVAVWGVACSVDDPAVLRPGANATASMDEIRNSGCGSGANRRPFQPSTYQWSVISEAHI